jgi:uncharacterized protein (UPF0262 family)
MAFGTLSELRIDEETWAAGSPARRNEWRLAIREVVEEGRFELANGPHGARQGVLRVGTDGVALETLDGAGQPPIGHVLPLGELRPLMDEYMQICEEMSRLGVGANSPRLEALDIAKRLTHDEAGELVRRSMPAMRPDHATARRLFTLLVTLYHDTTRLAAPPHAVRY